MSDTYTYDLSTISFSTNPYSDDNLTILKNTDNYVITLKAAVSFIFNQSSLASLDTPITSDIKILFQSDLTGIPTITDTTFESKVEIDTRTPLTSTGIGTLQITNTKFKYVNNSKCLIIVSGSKITVTNSQIDISPNSQISLTSLSTFKLNLTGGNYSFTPITNTNTFYLLDDVFLYNTSFTDNCNCIFNTDSNTDSFSLTFAGCTFIAPFNTTIAETNYLCTTIGSGASVVSFVSEYNDVDYGFNSFIIYLVEQVSATIPKVWSNTGCVFNANNSPMIYMYLPEGDYPLFNMLGYFRNAIVVPNSTSKPYTFGLTQGDTTGILLEKNLYLQIEPSIASSSGPNLNFTICTNGGSVFLNNTTENINVIFSGLTNIKASSGNPAIGTYGTINNYIKLTTGGTYTNNNAIIFDKNLLISYPSPETSLGIIANYATATSRINLFNENIILHNYNNLYLTGADLHLYIPINLNGLFEFKNTSDASLSGSDIRSRIKLNLQSNFTIDSSYVAVTASTYIFDVPQNTPITEPQTLPLYSFTLSNSVIDVPNILGTTAVEIIGNIGLNTGHSLTGNTINIVQTDTSTDTSDLSFNLTNIKYNETYFKDTNIFNIVCGSNNTAQLVYGTAFTNDNISFINKSLNIASSSTISEFTSIDNIINTVSNTSFNIVGDKWVATSGTNGNNVSLGGSNCTITFKDITFSSSNTLSGSLINYIATNNDLETAGSNIKLKFTDTKFYTTSSINSLTTGFDTTATQSDPATNYVTSTYKVYLIGAGTFLLGNDPLVLLSDTVYFNNGNSSNATASNATLCHTDSNTKYPRRLTIIAETVDNLSNINLIVKAMGLDVIDNYTGEHYINLNGLGLSVTTEDVINITPNNTYSKININNSSTSGVIIYDATMTGNNIITIKNPSQTNTPSADRVLTIEALTGINFSTSNKIKHFIVNENTMLLNINAALDQDRVTHNMIYWPKLITMYNELSRQSYPLSGTAVKYAEAWEFEYDNITAYPTVLVNTYTDGSNSTTPGLTIDETNSTASSTDTRWNWTDNNKLQYLLVYSSAAFEEFNNFNITLNKEYSNTSTRHTGKLDDDLFETKNVSDNNVNGWLDCIINFTVDKLALMPFTNNVTLSLEPYNDSTAISGTWTNNAYQINQNQTITKDNTIYNSVYDYLNDLNILTAYYATNSIDRTTSISLTDIPFIVDGTETTESQPIKYNIASCDESNIMYLIRPLNITFRSGLIVRNVDHNDADYRPDPEVAYYPFININTDSITTPLYKTIIYPNIDDVLATNSIYSDGKSQEAIVDLDTDSFAWIVKTVDVSVNINNYQVPTSYTPITFSFNILNQSPDLQLVGIPMKTINELISSLTANALNTTTFDLSNLGVNNVIPYFIKDNINNTYTYVLTTYIALYSRVLPANFAPVLAGTVDIYENINNTNSLKLENAGTVTLTKDNNSDGVDDADNNITTINTIFRYKMVVTIDTITDLAIGSNYNVKFKLYDNTTPDHVITNPLNVVINYFTIPLEVYLSTNDAIIVNNMSLVGNIETIYNSDGQGDIESSEKDFTIYVNFSANITGNISLDFTNTDAGNTIDMSGFMSSIKLVNSDFTLSSTSTTTAISTLSTQIELIYRFSPPVIPGKFYIKVNLVTLTKTDETIWTISNAVDPITLTYLETRRHTIGITIGKVLNTPILNAGPPREVIAGVDVTTGVKAIVYDVVDTLEAKENVKLIPDSFTYGGEISSTNVKVIPFNKYTQYYLAVDTSSLGFIYNEASIQDSNISMTFIFKSSNVEVLDIEVYKIDGTTLPTTTNTIEILNAASRNPPTQTPPTPLGNQVLIFRRKLRAVGDTEQTYNNLDIYYKFNYNSEPSTVGINNSNHIYHNLGTDEHLLATIDYSNYGTSSQKFSEICIGNWRIVPSGDGAKLLFNRIESGNNPYSVTIPMNPTDISIDDFDTNDSTLLSLEKTPHDNVPT